MCARSHLPRLRSLQSPPLRHPLCAAAVTGIGWMQRATCGATGPRDTQVDTSRSPTQVGGKATSSLIKAGRQADCGAQPARLPGEPLAANSREVPALSPGTHSEGGAGRLRPRPPLLLSGCPCTAEETLRKLAEEIAAHPLGTLPSSGSNKGAVGRSPTGMEQDPVGPSCDRPYPHHMPSAWLLFVEKLQSPCRL